MKKIYVLSALTLLTAGLLTQPVKPVNEVTQELSFEEAALDYNNETGFKLENKNASVGVGEYDVSPTYVQFGMINEDGKDLYVMRFATAVKGDLTSLTYTRDAIEGKEANTVGVTTLYRGIKSGEETYYYNGTDLTTDEADAGNYYWACYTVKYNNGDHFATDLPVRLTVNGVEEASLTTSFDVEYGRVEDGSEAYPYLISTSEEWQSVIDEVNATTLPDGKKDIYVGEGVHYKLVSNINQTEVLGQNYIYFASVIDGNGYTINANISVDGERAALINRTSQKFVGKNLNVSGNISATNAVEFNGSVVAANYGTISNCSSNASLNVISATDGEKDLGGIVGWSSSHYFVENCTFNGNIITNFNNVGGIVGRLEGLVNNSINNANITISHNLGGYLGGIVGQLGSGGNVKDCVNYGDIVGKGSQTSPWNGVGGIVGSMYSKNIIENCVNYGDVTADYNVGGIAGYGKANSDSEKSQIINCTNAENAVITVYKNSGGGIIGRDNVILLSGNKNYGYYVGTDSVGYIYGKISAPKYDDGTNVNYYNSEN